MGNIRNMGKGCISSKKGLLNQEITIDYSSPKFSKPFRINLEKPFGLNHYLF